MRVGSSLLPFVIVVIFTYHARSREGVETLLRADVASPFLGGEGNMRGNLTLLQKP